MSKQANPTLVGGFVLGALGLLILAIVVFGSGSLFRERPRAVAFFQGNIQGLSVGAPVSLRGVRIGTVTDIRININTSDLNASIPVYLEFEPERLNFDGAAKPTTANQTILKEAIAKGLHARLEVQSMVTGQLLVDLSLDPNEASRLTGNDPKTVEIPTALSDVEKLKNALTNVPLDDIAKSLLSLLDHSDKLVTSPEIPALLNQFAEASHKLDDLLTSAQKQLPELLSGLTDTTGAARHTLAETDRLLASNVRDLLDAARGTSEQASRLLTNTGTLFLPSSPQRYDIDEILRNLSATTRSLRSLSDELNRRPNAVLLGR
jgi:paraquat-inducible protein B